MNEVRQNLIDYGFAHIKDVIPKEFSHMYTHILQMAKAHGGEYAVGDKQIPNAKAIVRHEIVFDSLLERLWPTMEYLVGEKLLPTYSYARLYTNGDELEKHTDRPACQVSLTLQLGRSHNYTWPIHVGKSKVELDEGSGIIYMGCDIEHWRETCSGPDGYYSGQVFLHYVFKNGQYANEYADGRDLKFDMFRTHAMENK
jgi:hypothetical protein